MGRAAKLKKERKAERMAAGSMTVLGGSGEPGGCIELRNPMQQQFATFIFANSVKCQAVVEENSNAGQTLVICGAGPSLAETAAQYVPKGDQVWGCNSALIYLHDNGHKVTHGFTVDQTPEVLGEWASTPDVEYLLASTVHPHLTDLLQGRGRKTRFFHNFVGITERPVVLDTEDGGKELMSYEDWLYQSLYPTTVRTGSGLNSVNRAIDLGLFMGFQKIYVLGADCALRFKSPPPAVPQGHPEHLRWMREEVTLHADGGHGLAANSSALVLFGTIDGRDWLTKPDMIISASWLEKTRQKHFPYSRPIEQLTEEEKLAERQAGEAVGIRGQIELIGDILPNALKDKPDEFLHRLPTMVGKDGKPLGWM